MVMTPIRYAGRRTKARCVHTRSNIQRQEQKVKQGYRDEKQRQRAKVVRPRGGDTTIARQTGRILAAI